MNVAEFRQALVDDNARLQQLVSRVEELGSEVDRGTMIMLHRVIESHSKNVTDLAEFVEGQG